MDDLSNEMEAAISQLAPLIAIGKVIEARSTPAQKERRAEVARWLSKLHSPQKVAELAVCAAEMSLEAWRHIQVIIEGLEAKENCEDVLGVFREAEHVLQIKIENWAAKGVARQEVARKAARAARANSPKQSAKLRVHMLWKDWQEGKGFRYRSAAEFACRMVEIERDLKSPKVIEAWVTKWRRESKGK